jgi:hypothetical protein
MAMITRHIFDINKSENNHNFWEIWWTDADTGLTRVHGMPLMLPAHLSAAYGIDLSTEAGADEVIHTVLYQHEIPDFTMPHLASQDPAMKLGHQAKLGVDTPTYRKGQVAPVHLYTARDQAHAREVHQIRMDDVKTRITYAPFTEVATSALRGSAAQAMLVTAEVEKKAVAHPYTKFREGHGITDDEVAKHDQFIRSMRMAIREGRRPVARPDYPTEAAATALRSSAPDHARRFLAIARDKKIGKVPDWVKAALPADEIAALTSTRM